jgi:hypothetical protein
MIKILCFTFGCILILTLGCSSQPSTSNSEGKIKEMTQESPTTCAKLGTKINFNDQRIVGFQKLVQLQILRIKALPMTEESTQELAEIEAIRRRVSYPLLTSTLRPVAVTKIIKREAKQFSNILESRKATDLQAQSLLDELNERFLPLLESEEHWNC